MKIPEFELNNSIKMPGFGFGTWNLHGDKAVEAVSEALKAGYRLIDTARIYGNESEVGQAILKSSVPREEIFVTTKLKYDEHGYDSALAAFEESRQRLGLDYVDLYLIHWPGDSKRHRLDSWRALVEIAKEGRAKSIGVSNYEIKHLKEHFEVFKKHPAVNQIEFHPYIYKKQKPILDWCQEHKTVVEAYSPLVQGRGLQSIVLNEIAERLNKTPAQVMLRWAIQHGTIPIPKSAHPDRIRENIDIFDFELSEQDMHSLNELSSSHSR